MECSICCRQPGSSLPFFCTTCARNATYESRVESAQVLLQKEAYGKEVKKALTLTSGDDEQKPGSSNTFQKIASNRSYSRLILEDIRAKGLKSKDQAEKISSNADQLQDKNQKLKEAALNRRKSIAERRALLSAAQKRLAHEQATAPEPIKKATAQIQAQWNSLHAFDVDSRIFLCNEAAMLLGLTQQKRKKGTPGRDLYMIANVPIPDLRDLNTADPTIVNVAVFRLAHLLHLITSYLSLRLPAELTPPCPAHPYPTLAFPQFSYNSKSTHQSAANPPTPIKKTATTFLLPQHTPPPPKQSTPSPRSKPHALHLPTKLADFAREDPTACSSFLDAIILLAWDIAWLCRVQGLDVGSKNWEEICAMGRNLYTLLLAPPESILPLPKPSAEATAGPSASPSPAVQTTALGGPAPSDQVRLGHYSHDSNWAFLGGAKGQEFQKSWRYASPSRLVDRMKLALANEREGAEWEVLGEEELKGWREGELGDEGEEVGGEIGAAERYRGVADGEAKDVGKQGGKGKEERGNKGWAKFMSRGGDA